MLFKHFCIFWRCRFLISARFGQSRRKCCKSSSADLHRMHLEEPPFVYFALTDCSIYVFVAILAFISSLLYSMGHSLHFSIYYVVLSVDYPVSECIAGMIFLLGPQCMHHTSMHFDASSQFFPFFLCVGVAHQLFYCSHVILF